MLILLAVNCLRFAFAHSLCALSLSYAAVAIAPSPHPPSPYLQSVYGDKPPAVGAQPTEKPLKVFHHHVGHRSDANETFAAPQTRTGSAALNAARRRRRDIRLGHTEYATEEKAQPTVGRPIRRVRRMRQCRVSSQMHIQRICNSIHPYHLSHSAAAKLAAVPSAHEPTAIAASSAAPARSIGPPPRT